MKKLIIAFLILFMSCSSVLSVESPPPLTPEQMNTLQLDIDILGMCTIDNLTSYIKFGFTTEYAVSKGFEACSQEGQNVVDTMDRIGLTEKEQITVIMTLFKNMVKVVDDARNADAQKKLKAKSKEISI